MLRRLQPPNARHQPPRGPGDLLDSFCVRGRVQAVVRQERHVAGDAGAQLSQTAKTIGYNSGKQAGINDRKRGEPSSFRDESAYQKATQGYTSGLGNKEHYKQVFREAFENGYRDGWNGY